MSLSGCLKEKLINYCIRRLLITSRDKSNCKSMCYVSLFFFCCFGTGDIILGNLTTFVSFTFGNNLGTRRAVNAPELVRKMLVSHSPKTPHGSSSGIFPLYQMVSEVPREIIGGKGC